MNGSFSKYFLDDCSGILDNSYGDDAVVAKMRTNENRLVFVVTDDANPLCPVHFEDVIFKL